jgi:hypothetical protein
MVPDSMQGKGTNLRDSMQLEWKIFHSAHSEKKLFEFNAKNPTNFITVKIQ